VKTFFRYVWSISSCLVQLAIILFVFGHLKGRTEDITVAILGLLYVTIRSIAIGLGVGLFKFWLAMDKELIRIREMLGEDASLIQERNETNTRLEDKIITGGMVITGIFLSIVGLICLVVLFQTIT
jgi:hypothetical protein